MILKEDFLHCNLGLYKIYWKEGGYSLAAIGVDYNGNRWIAATNWTCPKDKNPTGYLSKFIKYIKRMTLLYEYE